MADAVVQLRCGVKNDSWGKPGKESMAARLWSKTPGTGEVDDSKTYSEVSPSERAVQRERRLIFADVDGNLPNESILSPLR